MASHDMQSIRVLTVSGREVFAGDDLAWTVGDMQDAVATEMDVPRGSVRLMCDGKLISKDQTLAEFGHGAIVFAAVASVFCEACCRDYSEADITEGLTRCCKKRTCYWCIM